MSYDLLFCTESSLSFASGVYNVLEDAGTVQICLQLHAPSDGSEAEKRAFVLFSSSKNYHVIELELGYVIV